MNKTYTLAIEFINLTVSYNQVAALRGITTGIPLGKTTCIVGPNGAGKSTLLKALIGLETPDTGEISILGKTVSEGKKYIAYLPQREQIDWDFPVVVEDLVMMGRYPSLGTLGWTKKKDREAVEKALQEVKMEEYRNRHIRLLSGGQQQRVFIARALVQEAEILFMDEPFMGVDARTQQTILGLIDRLKEGGKTIVIINHDLNLVSRFDHLIMINKQLIASGPPREVYTDQNYQLTYGGLITMVDQAEHALWRETR